VLQMPTRVENLPEDQALRSLPPPSVRVQVQGEGLQLLRLFYNPPTIPINAATEQINLALALPELPKNVRTEGVSPSFIELQKERRITRKVPVQLRADIDPAETYDLLGPPRIRPDSIDVTGARSVIGTLSYWPTVATTFSGLRDSLLATVLLADTLSGLVAPSARTVSVFAVAEQFSEGSRELQVDVQGLPSSEKYVVLDPPTVEVRYWAPVSQHRAIEQAADFYAMVSYEDIRTDTTGRVKPQLNEPSNVVLRDVEIDPPMLRYYNYLNGD
jgi:hypothetical protein